MSQAAAQPLAERAAGAPRLLVVDDEQHMCDVCARTLQRAGYDVTATNDPLVATTVLRSGERFDLLLTDIKMPAMSGLDLAHFARECDPAIAIIIMTGFASLEHLQQSVQRGVADFLSKPFELDQLRLAVDQALHKRSLLQDSLRLRALEQLLDSSETLSATLELAELVPIALNTLMRLSGARAGFLLLAEQQRLPARPTAASAEAELLDAGWNLARRAFEAGQALGEQGAAYCSAAGASLDGALAVPLRAQGVVNGVVLLGDGQAIAARPGAHEAIMLLANHAGAALRNASLYGQLDDAYQRLQDLDRLKSEFIAIASHELRTPLSIVLGYTMMVREQSEGERREYLQRVMENAQRIKEIVDDMVNLRHVDTGQAQPLLAPVDLVEVIGQTIEHHRPAASAGSLTLAAQLPEPPVVFLSDREKIGLALSHLIANAIKFTPPGGSVLVSVEVQPYEVVEALCAPVTLPDPTARALPWVTISVRDTGIGIPAREQTRIFDRFYQVADSLTRDRGGAGLGLALVRELVGALGGAVWLVSREGEGSLFSFALPLRAAAVREV